MGWICPFGVSAPTACACATTALLTEWPSPSGRDPGNVPQAKRVGSEMETHEDRPFSLVILPECEVSLSDLPLRKGEQQKKEKWKKKEGGVWGGGVSLQQQQPKMLFSRNGMGNTHTHKQCCRSPHLEGYARARFPQRLFGATAAAAAVPPPSPCLSKVICTRHTTHHSAQASRPG